MDKRFVIVSGLPGSGKSTLAEKLAPALGLPLIDKDTILERLFESRGTGNRAWRRALSRESDRILQSRAVASDGAVLVSHWHLPGMLLDSGTPTDWIREISNQIVNVHCCDPEIAAERFFFDENDIRDTWTRSDRTRRSWRAFDCSPASRLLMGGSASTWTPATSRTLMQSFSS